MEQRCKIEFGRRAWKTPEASLFHWRVKVCGRWLRVWSGCQWPDHRGHQVPGEELGSNHKSWEPLGSQGSPRGAMKGSGLLRAASTKTAYRLFVRGVWEGPAWGIGVH